MRDLPTGTVTFLFTDVDGSTRLVLKLGAAGYGEALAEFRRLCREAFVRHQGVEVDTQGDAFFVAFARATDAVGAAQEAQKLLASGQVRARMGLHTGEPVLTEEGYVGLDVHRGARIAAAGHGGQVLLSQATRDLVAAEVRDLGLHRLKDLSVPQRLFQLGTAEFPPLRTLYRTNFPVPATTFVGRVQEVEATARLLGHDDVRMLTLVGPGGTGKTRLALQTAAELTGRYPDGVFWVSLASLRDPQLVLPTVAEELGARNELAEHIGDSRMLLLLDNFEPVVAAASEVARLLAACPMLDLLVTSREPLHVSGERVYAIPSLVEKDAVSLFSERALANGGGSAVGDTITDVCRRLDNLPLAIELAAARTNVLTPAAILERIELAFLTGGPRDAPERQRTLRATIEWSFDLLIPEEQQLLTRLAIFPAGCTFDAAAQVCDADLDALGSLVDKSLVRHRDGRYWMLETIREYALEQLDRDGTHDATSRALAEYLVALPEGGSPALGISRAVGRLLLFPTTRHAELLLELLEPELDNLRASVHWALAAAEPELGLQLAIEAWWVAASGGNGIPFEHRQWLDQGLRAAGSVSPQTRADATYAAASIAFFGEDFERATALAERSLHLHRELADDAGSIGDLHVLGNAARSQGDYDRAKAFHEQCLAVATRISDAKSIYVALHMLGELALDVGELDSASKLLGRSTLLAREVRDQRFLPAVIHASGDVALIQHDVPEAVRLYGESLRLDHQFKLESGALYCLAGLAAAAAIANDIERAGRLWGSLGHLERETRWPIPHHDRRRYEGVIAAHSETAPIAFAAAAEKGRRMSFDQAVTYALTAR